MTVKTRRPGSKTDTDKSLLFYRVSALLHTVRCIAQREDQLCTLMNELKQRQTVPAGLSRELLALLGEMPSQAYADDFEGVLELLEGVPAKAST